MTAEVCDVVVCHPAVGLPDQSAVQVGSAIYADPASSPYGPNRRLYWLPDYGVQLVYEPWDWRGEWYVDLVEVAREEGPGPSVYRVRDLEVDVVVEGMGPTYRVIDLEVFGRRAVAGEFALGDVERVLGCLQAFLDAFLHRGGPWPPPAIAPFFSPMHDYIHARRDSA